MKSLADEYFVGMVFYDDEPTSIRNKVENIISGQGRYSTPGLNQLVPLMRTVRELATIIQGSNE